MKTGIKLVAMWSIVMFSIETQAIIRYVKVSATGAGDGSTWANASGNIQAMLNASAVGDEVWVMNGIYNLSATLIMKEGVNVYGGFNGGESLESSRGKTDLNNNGLLEDWEFAYATVLNGQNSRQVLNQPNDFSVLTTWNGFTIRGGRANDGGGVYLRANGKLLNCIIRENVATRFGGGGVFNEGGMLTYCLINNNSTNSSDGGGIYNIGGTITNCIVSENYSSLGGGIYNEETTCLTNVLVVQNQGNGGSGIYCNGGNHTLINATISGNYTANNQGSGIETYYVTSMTIQNSIIWGNGHGVESLTKNVFSTGNSPIYANTLLGAAIIGGGIISNSDPLFIDAANGIYLLQVLSPARDNGNNSYCSENRDLSGRSRIFGSNIDLGAYENDNFLPNAIQFSPLTFIYSAQGQSPVAVATSGQSPTLQYKRQGESDLAYTANKPVDIGTYTIQASLPQLGLYEAVTDSADFEILVRDITVGRDTGWSVYGDNPVGQGLKATNLPNGVTESDLTGLSTNIPITSTTNTGTYKIWVTGTLTNQNYNITSSDTGIWVVTQRPLTIKAIDETIHYGDIPALKYTIVSGNLVNGDTLSGTLYVDNYNVGIHVITQGTLTANNNYEITFEEGTLTVIGTGDVSIKEIRIDNATAQRAKDDSTQFAGFSACGLSQTMINVVCNNPYTTVKINGIDGNPAAVDLQKYGTNKVDILVTSDDYNTQKYSLTVQKLIPFEQVVKMRWNNTLTVITPAENNGGFYFTSYKWFCNDKEISTEQSWSISEKGDWINPADEFYVEFTAEGYSETLRTCKSFVVLRDIDMKFYPNPVSKGQIVHIEVDMNAKCLKDAVVEVYNMAGNLMETLPLNSSLRISVDGKYAAGDYLLVLKGKDGFRKEMKVMVQ